MHSIKRLFKKKCLYLYSTLGMLTAAKASESPKSNSLEQREGYCQDLNLNEEIVPGAAIIAYNHPEGQDLGEGYNNVNNLPGHLGQPGEVDEGELESKEEFDLGLQQGEPDSINYEIRELNNTINQLIDEQPSLQRRLTRLGQQDKSQQNLRDYKNSLQLHQHKLNQVAADLEPLYHLHQEDSTIQELIRKIDVLRDDLDKLILSYRQKNEQASESKIAKEQKHLSIESTQKKYLIEEYNKLLDQEKRINRWQIDLKFKLQDNADTGSKWAQELEKQQESLQLYETRLTLWSDQLQGYLMAITSETDMPLQEQKELLDKKEVLQKSLRTFIRRKFELNAKSKKSNNANNQLDQVKNSIAKIPFHSKESFKHHQQALPWHAFFPAFQQYYAPIRKGKIPKDNLNKADFEGEYMRLDDEANEIEAHQIQLYMHPHSHDFSTHYKSYKQQLKKHKRAVKKWQEKLHDLLNSGIAYLPVALEAKSIALDTKLQKLVKGNIHLGQLHQSNSNHNNFLPESQVTTQITADGLIKKHTKLQNHLENLQKCQANLLKKKVRSEKWQKKYNGYKASVHDYHKKVVLWETQFNQHLTAHNGNPQLQKLSHKHATLRNTLQQLIKTNETPERQHTSNILPTSSATDYNSYWRPKIM